MKNLRFICCQPASLYYAWQVEVLINNFLEMGIQPSQIDIVCNKVGGIIPSCWKGLMSYPVTFHFYNDTRELPNYVSSIRPNILKQHFAKFPELSQDAIFYHDCDIIFTRPIDWITEEMINDDNWYGSEVGHYLNREYILSKGQKVMDLMCEVMELPEKVIELNNSGTIGAQYLMKNVTSDYWARVEKDSEDLFVRVNNFNARLIFENALEIDKARRWHKKKPKKYHELQIWCADMFAVLWNAWRMGFKTISDTAFDFSWASAKEGKEEKIKALDRVSEFERCNIFHNAGVTDGNQGLFFKADYQDKTPYDTDLKLKEGASAEYYKLVKKVGKISKIK